MNNPMNTIPSARSPAIDTLRDTIASFAASFDLEPTQLTEQSQDDPRMKHYEPIPQPLNELTKVRKKPNDYLPQRKVMRRKRSNIFQSKEPKNKINIDTIAEGVQIPFASFVDQKMIKDNRRTGAINK